MSVMLGVKEQCKRVNSVSSTDYEHTHTHTHTHTHKHTLAIHYRQRLVASEGKVATSSGASLQTEIVLFDVSDVPLLAPDTKQTHQIRNIFQSYLIL